MSLPQLSAEEREKLLRWARRVIEDAVSGPFRFEIPEEELSEGLQVLSAAFVTLRKHGELRGCIGKMDFQRPLWDNVLHAAVAAAQEDPRFPPVQYSELDEIQLSISLLDQPEDLPTLELFDPQRQGIIVEKGWHHALLLPKVAQEHGWDAAQTLDTVCQKAGLAPDAWREPDMRFQVFTTLDFGETEEGQSGG